MADNYSFSEKFVKGETKSGIWNLASYATTLVSSFVILYFLSVYEYGLYQLILSIIALAQSLTGGIFDDLVMSDLCRYLGGKDKKSAKQLFSEYAFSRVTLTVFLSVLIFLGDGLIGDHYNIAGISLFIKMAGIILIFQVIYGVINFFFKANLYFGALGSPVVGEVSRLIAMLFLFQLQGFGMFQVMVAYLVGAVGSLVFSFIHFLRVYKRTFPSTDTKHPRQYLLPGLVKEGGVWLGLRYILSRISNNLRPWIIKLLLGTEYVGIFAFSKSIVSMLMSLLPFGMFQTLFSYELGKKERWNYLYTKMVKYGALAAFLLSILSFVAVPEFITLFLPKYSSAISIFRIMSVTVFMYAFYKIFRMILVSFKDIKTLTIRAFDNSFLSPALLFVTIFFWGGTGIAIEWSLTYAITTIIFYYYLAKKYHPHFQLNLRELVVFDKHDRTFLLKIYRLSVKNFCGSIFKNLKH